MTPPHLLCKLKTLAYAYGDGEILGRIIRPSVGLAGEGRSENDRTIAITYKRTATYPRIRIRIRY